MFKNLDATTLGLSPTQSETIELALSYGFKGIDLDIAAFSSEVKALGLPKARRLLDSAKLKVGTFPLPIDWQREAGFEDELKKLAELVGLAAALGARRAVTVVAPANDERPYHQNFEFCAARLTEVGRALEPHGLTLGVGFDASPSAREQASYEFVRDLDALLVLLSTVSAKNVGLWFNVWQVWVSGASVDEARQKAASAKVVALSLADADQSQLDPRDLAARRLPGETGAIDSAAILASLANAGYEGPVTPLLSGDAGSLRRNQMVKQAGEKLDAVWKAAGLGPPGKTATATGK